VALCASLPQAKARGAICVSVLESELADTLSLDYQQVFTLFSSSKITFPRHTKGLRIQHNIQRNF
jgi:hypothetical protein